MTICESQIDIGHVLWYRVLRFLADCKLTCTRVSIQTCHVAERSEIIFQEMVCSDWIGGNLMYWISEKFETKANNETDRILCEELRSVGSGNILS